MLFSASRGGASELYVRDLATGVDTRLTEVGTAQGGANNGKLSPDGSRIAFQVRRGTDYEIHVRNVLTGEARNATEHAEYDVNPTWSPDGTRIAFMSTRGFELGGNLGPFPGHLYVLDLATDSLRPVTREPLTSSLGPSDWSPDGATLLLARLAAGRPRVFALDLASGDERYVGPDSTASASAYSASFDHAGTRIAYHWETESESQIAVMDAYGGGSRILTSGPGWRYNPRWSPDDAWILFTASDDGGQYDLKAVRVSDRALRDLVVTPEDEREGEWWPIER